MLVASIKVPSHQNKNSGPEYLCVKNRVNIFWKMIFGNLKMKNFEWKKIWFFGKIWKIKKLIKAILPTFEVAALCLQILTPALFVNENTVFTVIFSDIPIHLAPVLNPLGTILLIKPYRRSLFGIFKRWRVSGTESSLPVSTIAVRKGRATSLQPPIATVISSSAKPTPRLSVPTGNNR